MGTIGTQNNGSLIVTNAHCDNFFISQILLLGLSRNGHTEISLYRELSYNNILLGFNILAITKESKFILDIMIVLVISVLSSYHLNCIVKKTESTVTINCM